MVGSLTGAVSSQIVTEEYEGILGTVGHRTDSAMAKGCLTARLTSRADAKAGHDRCGPKVMVKWETMWEGLDS